jgi:hypothetical protein
MTPSAFGTSPKYDSKITLANLNLHVGLGEAGGGVIKSYYVFRSIRRCKNGSLDYNFNKISDYDSA